MFARNSSYIVAILLAISITSCRADPETQAKATIARHKGRLEQAPSVVKVNLSGQEVTDADLKSLAGLKTLTNLSLHGSSITDAGLAYLAGFDRLEELWLGDAQITDAGLVHLQKLPLTKLNLSGTLVTGSGLKYLAGLPITELSLDRTRVGDTGMAEIRKFSRLRKLDLGDQVTDFGIRQLKDLDLEELHIDSEKFTGVGIGDLKSLTTLFAIRGTIDAKGLKSIGQCTSLLDLTICNTESIDPHLGELAGLTNLKRLSLWGAPVTGAGIKGIVGKVDLEVLDLEDGEGATEDGLKAIAQIKTLRRLVLSEINPTGPGLRHLAALKNLEVLKLGYIEDGQEFRDALDDLQKKLPDLRIH